MSTRPQAPFDFTPRRETHSRPYFSRANPVRAHLDASLAMFLNWFALSAVAVRGFFRRVGPTPLPRISRTRLSDGKLFVPSRFRSRPACCGRAVARAGVHPLDLQSTSELLLRDVVVVISETLLLRWSAQPVCHGRRCSRKRRRERWKGQSRPASQSGSMLNGEFREEQVLLAVASKTARPANPPHRSVLPAVAHHFEPRRRRKSRSRNYSIIRPPFAYAVSPRRPAAVPPRAASGAAASAKPLRNTAAERSTPLGVIDVFFADHVHSWLARRSAPRYRKPCQNPDRQRCCRARACRSNPHRRRFRSLGRCKSVSMPHPAQPARLTGIARPCVAGLHPQPY